MYQFYYFNFMVSISLILALLVTLNKENDLYYIKFTPVNNTSCGITYQVFKNTMNHLKF